MPRGRKKPRNYENETSSSVSDEPTGLEGRLNHQSFDLIKNINIDRDSSILREFGVPCPVSMLSVETTSRAGHFGVILTVFSRYTEHLLETIDRCQDSKFSKRRTMFIKLINAINLKFVCAFRWKYYDRLLLKSIDRSQFGLSNNIQKVKEYLQIYQSLWQEHCRSMQRLLGEWNEVNYLLKTYKLDKAEEGNISAAIAELNQMVQGTTASLMTDGESNGMEGLNGRVPEGQPSSKRDGSNVDNDSALNNSSDLQQADAEPVHPNNSVSMDETAVHASEVNELADLLSGVRCNSKYINSINTIKGKIDHLKYTRTNQLQTIVNRTIGKYEDILDKIESYNETLIKVSNDISDKMFKRMPINDYVKLIQEMPHIQ